VPYLVFHIECFSLWLPAGQEGPKVKEPSKYIRYIYNRIILENATVRAAAVSSLANFGAVCESLRPRIVTLLKRALSDNDDEVQYCWLFLFKHLVPPSATALHLV
jgi:hypothetical protein